MTKIEQIDFLTTEEVGRELGLGIQRVRDLARARGLGRLIGRTWLFTPGDVAAMRLREPGRPIVVRGAAVRAELAARAGRHLPAGEVATRDLERYYALLRRELAALRLTEGEAAAIVDACNGVVWTDETIPYLAAQVGDALADGGLARKWGVNGAHLWARLERLTPAQCCAIVDAAEKFWRLPAAGNAEIGEQLRAVGLLAE